MSAGAETNAKRSGILAAGNWIVDYTKIIDAWPAQDTLANIVQQTRSNGGSPYNILKNLARLGASFPLSAIGLVGEDEPGQWILDDCRQHGIDTRQLRTTHEAPTSYTDVMTVRSTGRRTFFHHRGANALLAPRRFDFYLAPAKYFHLGYLLLLDALDEIGPDGRPLACQVLAAARRAGLLTSVDLVSVAAERFAHVASVLPEIDVLFLNEFEASAITGLSTRPGQRLDRAAVAGAAEAIAHRGVRQWVVVHFPEGVYAHPQNGPGLWHAAVNLPPEQIKGAAGAGDALAAGVLYGLHEEWPMTRCLTLGVAAAATCLQHPTCSEGVRPIAECLALVQQGGASSSEFVDTD